MPQRRAALVGQQVHGDRPALALVAERAVERHHHVVEEDLAELGRAVHGLDRPHGDAGRVHVDEEGGDAPVGRLRRAGAGEQHAALRRTGPGWSTPSGPRPASRRRRGRPGTSASPRLLPVPGSEKPWHHVSSPRSSRGTISAASSGGAKSIIVGASTSVHRVDAGLDQVRGRSAPRRGRPAAACEPPRPPTRSGQPQRIQPASKVSRLTFESWAICVVERGRCPRRRARARRAWSSSQRSSAARNSSRSIVRSPPSAAVGSGRVGVVGLP